MLLTNAAAGRVCRGRGLLAAGKAGCQSPRRETVILHVDMDAFFASVEQKERPWLEGKPVVVVGDPEKRHGVVTAASYAARHYGIKAGMSLMDAKHLCPHAIFLVGCYGGKYEYIASRLREIFYRFTPAVEPYSIDEAFLDITGCQRLFGSPVELGAKLKRTVKKTLGLSCSVGIAPNKLLAKLASSLDKPDGLMVISPDHIKNVLDQLEVTKLCGIGRRTARVLSNLGIHTLQELAAYPTEVLKGKFGIVGEWLHFAAQGIDHTPVFSEYIAEKSMGHERTLERDIGDPEEIGSVLLSLSAMVARRLRAKGTMGRTITLKIRHTDFATFVRSQTIPHPTDSEHDIAGVAFGLASQAGWGAGVRLLGVSVSNLTDQQQCRQMLLPLTQYGDKRSSIYPVIDKIRDKFGEDSINWGGAIPCI
jgi:DNA polymerase-4